MWEWIESLKSPGNLIAIALDVITDGNIWNHQIKISVGNASNDLGHVLQKSKQGKAYSWEVSFYYAF